MVGQTMRLFRPSADPVGWGPKNKRYFGYWPMLCCCALLLCFSGCATWESLKSKVWSRPTAEVSSDFEGSPFEKEAKVRPPRLPVNEPVQLSFEPDPVTYACVTPDGRWMAYTERDRDFSSLWLRSGDPDVVVVPRKLDEGIGDRYAPAVSRDGALVAYAGTAHDVKGDLYLVDTREQTPEPRRLTGRETEDGWPSFSPDGKRLVFHQLRPGERFRKLALMNLTGPGPVTEVLETGGDGSFPAFSPRGDQVAYVSFREDPGGDIYLLDIATGVSKALTQGPARDLYPQWSPDGESVYFTRIESHDLDESQRGREVPPVVFRTQAHSPESGVFPVTSASYEALQPMVGGGRLYFLSSRSGVGNVWTLPALGEIPTEREADGQMELAARIADKYPPDDLLAVLAYYRVVEAFPEARALCARALYLIGDLYLNLGKPEAAAAAFSRGVSSYPEILPEAALSRLGRALIEGRKALAGASSDGKRRNRLNSALDRLSRIAEETPGELRVTLRSRLDRAVLLMEHGTGSESLSEAVGLLDWVIRQGNGERDLSAEARVLRADAYRTLGNMDLVLPAYVEVVEKYSAVWKWSDAAIERILDMAISERPEASLEDRVSQLSGIADQYRGSLPGLAMGAWNRIGDLYYAADEWSKAKEAYRNVLDYFLPYGNQTAAARLALAEILYREERFRRALDLYEKEISIRPYEDYVYRLAREGYIRKSVAAAEFLYRLGEVPSARSMFRNLIREEWDLVEAHRGYVKCAAAQGEITSVLEEYRKRVKERPNDVTARYAAGLCLTYLDTEPALEEAQSLLESCIRQQGQIEFFHQTLGYVYEVLETVYHRPDFLEKALESYQKAYFLNNPRFNPENRAHLLLNMGNIHFLLGRYARAFDLYSRRSQTEVPFDNADTEVLFYRRFGASAFQSGDRLKPVEAYGKALDLIDERIEPRRASELFGRIERYISDRVLIPAREEPGLKDRADGMAVKQSALNDRLFQVSRRTVPPPPDPSWEEYRRAVEGLLEEQERIIEQLPPLILDKPEETIQTLSHMAKRVREALELPKRLLELKAEMLDRLGLAYQEAGEWAAARDSFLKAFHLNRKMGREENLAKNRRSAAYCAYMEAGGMSGAAREELLKQSLEGFREVLDLLSAHGTAPPKKDTREQSALVSLTLDVALDKTGATQALYGFSEEQEKRLAETFEARIQTELGALELAEDAVRREWARYPQGKPIREEDLYGVSLLAHRAGLLAFARRRPLDAFDDFERSAEIALRLGNPVSSAVNVSNMALCLSRDFSESSKGEGRRSRLMALDRRVTMLMARFPTVLENLIPASYHNAMGVFLLNAALGAKDTDVEGRAEEAALLESAVGHFFRAETLLDSPSVARNRKALALRSVVLLNLCRGVEEFGDREKARSFAEKALESARKGLLPALEWRALLVLGRYREALEVLGKVPLFEADCGPLEVTSGFAPLIKEMLDQELSEDAFNLIERLSEIERVQRLTPLLLAGVGEEDRKLAAKSYKGLLTLRDLESALQQAPEEDREYLSTRADQERELLDLKLGKDRERLPRPAALGATEEERNRILIVMGLSAHLDQVAERAVSEGRESSEDPDLKALVETYQREIEGAARFLNEPGSKGLLAAFVPMPVEAVEVMESLPDNGVCVRWYALPGDPEPWLAFSLSPDDFQVTQWKTGGRPVSREGTLEIWAYEQPRALGLSSGTPTALNATHLVRSFRSRKPFKRNLLMIGLPESSATDELSRSLREAGYEVTTMGAGSDFPEMLDRLRESHTVILNPKTYLAVTVPTRPGVRGETFPAFELSGGVRFPLERLAGRLSNVSLMMLSLPPKGSAYAPAHLLSLMGCPTVLWSPSQGEIKSFVATFLKSYEDRSALEGYRAALAEGETVSNWFYSGYWGMEPEAAVEFGKNRFNDYVRGGVGAYRKNQFGDALADFESALDVALEVDALKNYLPDLYKYSRESAFRIDRLDKAEKYARTLATFWEGVRPDSEQHAEALLRLGLVLARAERYEEAISTLEQAAEMMENLDLGELYAEALADLGVVLENAAEYDRALKRFQDAASLSAELGKSELLARQYVGIGRILDLRLSNYARAKLNYEKAYEIYSGMGATADMAGMLLDMGRCCRLLGDFPGADERYARALNLIRDDPEEERLRARIIIEQADNAWFQGRYQEAFELQRTAHNLAREHNWALEQVIALNTSGLTWWTLGDNERALRDLEDGLERAEKLRVRKDEVATTLNNMGLVYREMGRYDEALDSLERALAIDRKLKSRWAVAYDLRNKAQTLMRIGRTDEAVPLLEEALGEASAIGNRINESKTLLVLAEALVDLGRESEAREVYGRALDAARSMALRESIWRALYGLARIELGAGRRAEARDLLAQAVDVIEGMRAEIKLDRLKDGFISNKTAVYEALVEVLVDMGLPQDAFNAAERSRARNLIDLLGNQKLSLRGADREHYDRLNALRSRIREQETLSAQANSPAEKEVFDKALQGLNDDYRDLLLEIQARNPELASLVSVAPMTLDEVRGLIAADTALLSYYVTADRVLCWVVRSGSFELVQTPLGRESLGETILGYRRMIQNLEPLEDRSREIYDLLLGKLPSLEGVRVLGIVPHGPLHYLSFAVLFNGKSYLVDRYPLFYLPSAGVLKYTLERRGAAKNTRVLAVGNPALDNPALELPFAEREVETIHWNFPDVTVLTGEKATESWIVANIGKFGIIHFASHGEFDPVNPLFSSVKLVKDLKEDGNLEAGEVFGLDINADLVVLSACRTGLGRVTKGDDVIGMNRSFLYAGTHALISTLWRVSDISTGMLIKQFYRQYTREEKSESLRKAMLHVKNRFPHPGYWGAFVLVGDYQ